jgi:hypothetical protein
MAMRYFSILFSGLYKIIVTFAGSIDKTTFKSSNHYNYNKVI